jgi:hypothetical protein
MAVMWSLQEGWMMEMSAPFVSFVMTEEQKWLNSRSSPDNIPFQRQVA